MQKCSIDQPITIGRKSTANRFKSVDGEPSECFLYDTTAKPTMIERIFGEQYHVLDKYKGHQITIAFVLSVIAVYTIQGTSQYMYIAARYYTAAVWDFGPAEYQRFIFVANLPNSFKFVNGLLIDTVAIFGYKRKSYLLIGSTLLPISIFLLIYFADNYGLHLFLFTTGIWCQALCDVVIDALIVQRTEFKSHTVATRLQCLAYGSRYTSSIAGLLVSTQMYSSGEPHDILRAYWLYFAISLSALFCSFFIYEKRQKQHSKKAESFELKLLSKTTGPNDEYIHPTYSLTETLYLIFETLCRKSVFYPMLFLFILFVTPESGEALDFYLMFELGFTSVQIGYLGILASVAFLISVAILAFQTRESNANFSLRRMYLVWTLIAALFPFLALILVFKLNQKVGIPDFLFMASDTVFVETAKSMLNMGAVILLARLCPPGIEGVFFSVLASVPNAAGNIDLQLSSFLVDAVGIKCVEDPMDENSVVCDFQYLWLLIVLANLTTLFALILIKKVPNEKELEAIGQKLKNNANGNIDTTKSEMIMLFSWCTDYIFPFFRNKVCCCCLKDDQRIDETKSVI